MGQATEAKSTITSQEPKKNLAWLKEQIDGAIDQNHTFFFTIGEMITCQLNQPNEQRTDHSHIDFEAFFDNTFGSQLDRMSDKINKVFAEFEKSNGISEGGEKE